MPVSAIPAQGGLVVTGANLDRMAQAAQPYVQSTPVIAGVTTSSAGLRTIRSGDRVAVEFTFTLSAAPTGAVWIPLPVVAANYHGFGSHVIRGQVGGLDVSATTTATGFVYLVSSTYAGFVTTGSAVSVWGPTTPVTWASGDTWSGSFIYEAA